MIGREQNCGIFNYVLAEPHITEVTYFKGEQLSTTPLLDETKGDVKWLVGGDDDSRWYRQVDFFFSLQPLLLYSQKKV